jgi:hypothetical protein
MPLPYHAVLDHPALGLMKITSLGDPITQIRPLALGLLSRFDNPFRAACLDQIWRCIPEKVY